MGVGGGTLLLLLCCRVFWMQVWELVWVGDGFEPEFVGEGWWLEKNLGDWQCG